MVEAWGGHFCCAFVGMAAKLLVAGQRRDPPGPSVQHKHALTVDQSKKQLVSMSISPEIDSSYGVHARIISQMTGHHINQ